MKANILKILFFGTPEFAAIVLEKMINAGYKPITVVTTPDKPVGRKQILTPSPVKLLAQKNKIQVLQPEKILNLKSEILNLKPDLVVLAAFGQIIPKEILEIPKYGCLNVHPSLLPKYRGASPIQTAILNNDAETGVTIMLMDKLLDHGDIVASSRFKILDLRYNYQELTKKLAELGADLLIETIPKWVNNEIKAVPQNNKKATFTKIIKKEDGKINWRKSAEEIERMTRAYYPWPSAFAEIKDKKQKTKNKILKIIKAEALKMENKKEPGMVFLIHSTGSVSTQSEAEGLTPDKIIAVACGDNALILREIQLEGKKAMTAKELLNGYSWIIDATLS